MKFFLKFLNLVVFIYLNKLRFVNSSRVICRVNENVKFLNVLLLILNNNFRFRYFRVSFSLFMVYELFLRLDVCMRFIV